MPTTRRSFLKTMAASAALAYTPQTPLQGKQNRPRGTPKKRHLVTLSFDDGFRKSFLKTAEIYEKFGRSACLNVIATGHQRSFAPPGKFIGGSPRGDFGLWNELSERGHEIMPHSFRHANLRQLPTAECKDLIRRCLDLFAEKLKCFDPKKTVYNFAYNASTPELERWLATKVMAFRTGGAAINPLPHAGQSKLTCNSFGPGNCEKAIDQEIEKLLAMDHGWLIFNTHGLDDEGWGPIRSSYLERLLERLCAIDSVDVLPAGRSLREARNITCRN